MNVHINFHIPGAVFWVLGGIVIGGLGVRIFYEIALSNLVGKMFGWR